MRATIAVVVVVLSLVGPAPALACTDAGPMQVLVDGQPVRCPIDGGFCPESSQCIDGWCAIPPGSIDPGPPLPLPLPPPEGCWIEELLNTCNGRVFEYRVVCDRGPPTCPLRDAGYETGCQPPPAPPETGGCAIVTGPSRPPSGGMWVMIVALVAARRVYGRASE